jgi:hypothetical protein
LRRTGIQTADVIAERRFDPADSQRNVIRHHNHRSTEDDSTIPAVNRRCGPGHRKFHSRIATSSTWSIRAPVAKVACSELRPL